MTNSNRHILVIGATGMLGQPVARQLQADGFNVRILARTPEKAAVMFGEAFEIYKGDIEDLASLSRAFDGCIGVHISVKGGPRPEDYDRLEYRGTQAVVNAAKRASVNQITYLSAYTIQEKNARSPESRAKFKAEQVIRASGVSYTIFRAAWFMESLPLMIQGKQALVIGKQPHPLHWLAAADYARMVSRSYQTPPALNKELYICGPQAFTMKQALQTYCHIVAPHVQVSTMPTWLLSVLGRITFNIEWVSLAELMAYYDQVGEEGSPLEANELLGAPTTTLEQWCEARKLKEVNAA